MIDNNVMQSWLIFEYVKIIILPSFVTLQFEWWKFKNCFAYTLAFVKFRWKENNINAHHTQLLSHVFAYFLFHFLNAFFWLCGFVTHIIMCPANYFKFKLYKLMGSPKKVIFQKICKWDISLCCWCNKILLLPGRQ